ncbi:MAG: GTPase ObgE [Firmicutes bacterium]|nr:GTPase ObgE [Bacillota bacterium]
MFIDKARIYVKAGDGGDGVVRFRREKYVPAGGPAGGDGGRGGSIYFEVDEGLSTLFDFRYRRKYVAKNGESGQSKNMAGKDAPDVVIKVPPGTLVKCDETGELLVDLTEPGQRVLVLPGGRGGRGNSRFVTPTRQAPAFAERGEPGEALWLDLELKLLADVGLVGYPNAGKSTLLSVVSAAKPKVANYPFTTLTPNLGVVSLEPGSSFVIADVPGLIEGAHQGVGLGMEFLRHIERTRVIVHIVDAAGVDGRDPVEDYYKINRELKLYSEELWACPQFVVANKVDLPEAQDNISRLRAAAQEDERDFYAISAATGQGTKELMHTVGHLVFQLKQKDPVVEVVDKIVVPRKQEPSPVDDFSITKDNNDYVVEGAGLERLMRRLDLNNEEAIAYLLNLFEKIGLNKALADLGVPEGATVRVGELEFEYME